MSKFAKGGVVKGAGSKTDDRIPSFMLTRGCAVVSAATAARLGKRTLERLNGGDTEIYIAEDLIDDDAC